MVRYPICSAAEAMRQLAAARHVGKVVLQGLLRLPSPASGPAHGRWVVTGGTGALGVLTGAHTLFSDASLKR